MRRGIQGATNILIYLTVVTALLVIGYSTFSSLLEDADRLTGRIDGTVNTGADGRVSITGSDTTVSKGEAAVFDVAVPNDGSERSFLLNLTYNNGSVPPPNISELPADVRYENGFSIPDNATYRTKVLVPTANLSRDEYRFTLRVLVDEGGWREYDNPVPFYLTVD